MKRLVIILILLQAIITCYSQIANNWVFGLRCGLNFATNPPTPFTDSIDARTCVNHIVDYGSWASNSISDCDGNLLFYTNGEVVWNRNHQLMPNSCLNDTPAAGNFFELQTKILKFINNDTLYYIFYTLKSKRGLRYAIVNMNADNGNGNIISNHNVINNFYSGTTIKYVTPPELIKHANDSNYWLVCKPTDTEMYSYLITSLGINLNPVISTVISVKGNSSNVTKASLSGKFIVLTNPYVNDTSYILDFNRSTGVISNKRMLCCKLYYPHILTFRPHSIEFSPNDSFIYIATSEDSLQYFGLMRLIQIQPYLSNPISSAITIYSKNLFDEWSTQLGPDGKIYISNTGTSILSCITRPDELGSASNFVYNYQDMSPDTLLGGFPSVYFQLHRLKFNATTYSNTSCLTDSVRLFVQGDTNFLNYRWYFYDSTNVLIDSTDIKNPIKWFNPGAYKIKLRAKNPQCNSYTWWTDDIYISYKPKVIAAIDSTKISCGKQTVYIHYSAQLADSILVNWGDGTSSPSQSAMGNIINNHDYYDSCKVYTITITARNSNCTTTVLLKDTVVLQPKPQAKFFANNPTKTFPIKGCTILNINLTDSSKNADSVWYVLRKGIVNCKLLIVNDTIQDTGWFDIKQFVSTKDGCIDSFVVNNAIYVAPKPTVQIQKDTTYKTCIQEYLRLKINAWYNDSVIINWGDGNTDNFVGSINGNTIDTITHHYTTPGSYVIIASGKNAYCNTLAFMAHLVRPPLQLTISNNIILLCKGMVASPQATASGGDSVFTYILKDSNTMYQNASGIFLMGPNNTRSYSIGAFNACANDTIWKQITVIVSPPLTLQVNATDTTLCKGTNYNINATANGGNGKYAYFLKKNNIPLQSNTTGSFNVTANTNELYTVLVTDSCTVINDSVFVNIKIFNVLQFTQTLPDVYLCPDESVLLKANTNNGNGTLSYLWYDAASNTTLSTTDTLRLTPYASVQLILKVTDACTSIYDTVWVYEFATASGTQLITDVLSGCVPLTVNFETPTLTYSNTQPCEASWDFGDGNTLTQNFTNTSASLKAKHIYANAGVYNAEVKAKFKNGTTVCYIFNATVEALIVPQIRLSISPKKVTLPKTLCAATITAANADSVVIDWADGFTDNITANVNLITQTHDYADTGHYLVKATAYNKNTCYTETTAGVYHADTFMCFIPNVFTPNRDATNEIFKPVVSFCKSYELIIFNRWGEEVYKTNYTAGKNQPQVWNGEGCEMDTYIYILTALDGDNMRYSFKGTVILVR